MLKSGPLLRGRNLKIRLTKSSVDFENRVVTEIAGMVYAGVDRHGEQRVMCFLR